METGSNMETDTNIQEASEAQNNNKLITSLNADCWRLVLDYLSVKELLRSEATCKDWQKLILNHISRRPVVICEYYEEEDCVILRRTTDAWASFKRWVKKCGSAVQEFDMDCQCFKDVVEVLRENCPNLNMLKFRRLKKKLSPTSTLHFQKLTNLTFEYCDEVTDDCISQFLNNELNELAIIYNKRVTGRFLNNLKSDMKYLSIRHCRAFKFPFLLYASLSNLEEFKFWKRNRSKVEIRDKLHLLLDKMPNLREIVFSVYDMHRESPENITNGYEDRLVESNVFFESVCRLSKLNSLIANFQVWDHHLEALGSSCEELAAVQLFSNNVTKRGLDALCRSVGPRLCRLDLSESQITDEDLVACIYACPNLMFLDICDCPLFEHAIYRVAVARRDMCDTVPSVQRLHRLGVRLQVTISPWDFWEKDLENYKDILDIRYPEEIRISTSERAY